MVNYLSLFFILLLTGCERLLIEPRPAATPISTFEMVWKTLDAEYPFFALKGVDWNALYKQYRPQITETMTDRALAQSIDEMLRQLRDGHVKLLTGSGEYGYDWAGNALPNFVPDLVAKYVNGQFLSAGKSLKHGLLTSNIAYIYCPTLQQGSLTNDDLNTVANSYTKRGVTNVVVDLRDNVGGLYSNANRLLSLLITQEISTGYERYRSATTHDEFTRWYLLSASPYTAPFTGQIIVLTNRRVYSAANYVVAALKGLPNVTVIGDQTGGGGANVHSTELPNGWRLAFPASQYADRAYVLTEGGITPDLYVNLLPEDYTRGKDTLIETALSQVK